jgi:cellobiose epimerase
VDRLAQLRTEAYRELTENILPFSMLFVVDAEQGGFYGHVANDRTVQKETPKALIQHSRMLWTFACADRIVGDPRYRRVASHARKALMDWFWDAEDGGFFWMVDYRGRPLRTDKLTYGQAFGIYALVEDNRAYGKAQALANAVEVYRLVEGHCRDPECGGYWEACMRDWTPAPGQCVDTTSLPVAKGMNSHLHLLEAYTQLLRAWDDGQLRTRLRALVEIMLYQILDPDTKHLCLFFDRDWHALSNRVSYGHDIEGSWLLVEAAEVLGDADLLAEVRRVALQMACATLEQGMDADGGLVNEGDPSGVTDRAKVWWPQAEAVVGFLNAYQLSGDRRFLDASVASWRFIQQRIVDKQRGDWFWGIDEAGHPVDREKAGPWKASYHSSRACLEVMQRVQQLTSGA